MTTLSLVAQGTEGVPQGQRRWVEAHGLRGQSYLKLGWHGVKHARSQGYELITRWHLSPQADPVPAMASKLQHPNHPEHFSALEFQDAVA